MQAGLLPGFLFHGYVRAISPSSPRQTGLDHLVETDLCSYRTIPWRLGPPSDHPQRRTWIAPRSSCRSEPGSRPDHRWITSRYHAQTVVDLFRNAKFDPHSNPLAAPNLGSPAPTPPRSHCEETKNKKSARIATFLRLAIDMGFSDRGSRCKSAGNRLFSSVFLL